MVPDLSGRDPKRNRAYVIVSRHGLIETGFSTVICAPVYSHHHGLTTQVRVGIDEGLKHDSSIHCDELMSLIRSRLTRYLGTLPPEKIKELNQALKAALSLDEQAANEI